MIVAGFGCRAGATPDALLDALEIAWAEIARAGRVVAAVAAPQDRAILLGPIAARLGLPLIAIEAAALVGHPTPTRSPASLSARGTGSVAEAAALVAAGPGAQIVVPRVVSSDRMATCAIAEGIYP